MIATIKKFDLAKIITILANIGVVIGLVFLTLEIRQNNDVPQFSRSPR